MKLGQRQMQQVLTELAGSKTRPYPSFILPAPSSTSRMNQDLHKCLREAEILQDLNF